MTQTFKNHFTVLSLFDGMSCGHLALDRAEIPITKYYASEIDKYAIKITQDNFPETIQLGDITKWREWGIDSPDIIIGGSPCFVAGTKVILMDGIKNIEDVVVGDMVLTHNGVFKPVLRIGSREQAPILCVKAQGVLPTYTTAEHPFFVRSMRRVYNKEKRTQERQFYLPKWKAASTLDNNDYVGLPILNNSSNYLNITKEEAYIIGRYIADGHTRKDMKTKTSRHYQLILSIGNKKIEAFKENIKENNYSCYKHTKSTVRVVFSSKRLVEIVETNCGSGAYNKHLSMLLLNLPIDVLRNVIEGFLAGDGSERKGVHRFTTVSHKLILSMGLAIAKVYQAGFNYEFTKRPDKTVIENRVVNQKDTHTLSFQKEVKKQSHYKIIDGYVWLPVKQVKAMGKLDRVYNIEVMDDNSYTANGVAVHNCQGFSFAGKQLNFDDPRSKLFFEFAAIVKHYKPKYFLLENVKMKKESEAIITETLGVSPIEINSALVSAQNRKRLYWTNIPNVTQPEDKGILLVDILESGSADRDKSYCIDANYYKGGSLKNYLEKKRRQLCMAQSEKRLMVSELKGNYRVDAPTNLSSDKFPTLRALAGGKTKGIGITDNITWRKLTPIECERLQTLPDNYTYGVSNTQRYKAIGNGWTVDVLAHIFEHIEVV